MTDRKKIETALAASMVRWAFLFGFLLGALAASAVAIVR